MKKCEYCNREFEPKRKKFRFCSKLCNAKFRNGWPKPEEIEEGKKYCTSCKRILDESSFRKDMKAKISLYWCTECIKKHPSRDYAKNRKQRIIDYMGGKCVRCGYNKCQNALDIHHRDPSKKDLNFRKLKLKINDDLKKELENCILVCATCHREIHAGM